MVIIILILIGVIIVLSLFLIKVILDLKSINQQTKIKLETDTHFIMVNDLKLKELNILCNHLNLLYQKVETAQINENKREREFKEMLSYIAHDVRTPLTSVQGYLQILQVNSVSKDNEAYYEIINKRLLDIKNLLEQFFFYSKVINDDYKLEFGECHLYDICCQSVAGFYQQFIEQKMEPVIDFEDKQKVVYGNKDMLYRLFDNLINNALIHGDGQLSIIQKDNNLYIKNSIELPNSIDPTKVFERFYKADTSRKHISSGLGLTIVQEIVRMMEADVEAILEDNIFTIMIRFNENK